MSEQTTPQPETHPNHKDRCCGGASKHEKCCSSGRRGRCIGKIVGIVLIFGLGFCAGKSHGSGPGWGHHGGPAAFMSGQPINAEMMNKFAEKRVKHMLDEVKASDEQKSKALTLVKAAVEKGIPFAEKLRNNHRQIGKLISAATLDKTAIETLRVEQIKLTDEVSKLMTQTMQDIAEILTPEQRATLAEKMDKKRR